MDLSRIVRENSNVLNLIISLNTTVRENSSIFNNNHHSMNNDMSYIGHAIDSHALTIDIENILCFHVLKLTTE